MANVKTYTHKNNLWDSMKNQLDKYATFSWDDHNMAEEFHAFIINESKGSLKFYNGPSFSNSYTQPQFESASNRYIGTTFKTQQISFTIAVYAVTEELYRKLIYVLHPYTIGNLIFDFQPQWRYVVKLAGISDSTRYLVGYDEQGKELFYTELKLVFETQGDAVAYSVSEIDTTYNIDNNTFTFTNRKNGKNVVSSSDLNTPILLTFAFTPDETANNIDIKAVINKTSNQNTTVSFTLFEVGFTNLTNSEPYVLEYNSQTGDLCLVVGDERKILTLLTTHNSGKRIVTNLLTNSYLLPGELEEMHLNGQEKLWSNLKLQLQPVNCKIDCSSTNGYGINCYARTNLI